jgi:hypothetical protein
LEASLADPRAYSTGLLSNRRLVNFVLKQEYVLTLRMTDDDTPPLSSDACVVVYFVFWGGTLILKVHIGFSCETYRRILFARVVMHIGFGFGELIA